MKKFLFLFLVFAMFFLPQTNIAVAESDTQTYVVTANYCYIYQNTDFSSEKLVKIENKSKILIETENGDAKKYLSDGFVFYKVTNYENTEGYVFSDFVCPESFFIKAIPNSNAKTNTACKLFFKQNNAFVESELALKKNHKLFLYEGFNKKNEYTAVAVLLDNEVYYGYLQTQYVNPKGINPLLITCVVIILAVLGIIFAWLFIKKRK